MRHTCKSSRMVRNLSASTGRTRHQAARKTGKQPARRCLLRLEQLELRLTLIVLGTFELDGNVTTGGLGTSGSTTTSHDWDQVFADNNVVPATNTAAALASSFATDAV